MSGRIYFAIAGAALGACVTTTTTRPPSRAQPAAQPDRPVVTEPAVTPAPVTPTFQAVTPAPWLELPLPDGVTPVVIDAGPLGAGSFVAGFHQVNGAARRWVVRISAAGKMSAVDAGAGTLTAAAAASSGTDVLLAGGTWFGRVNPEGRVIAEATFAADVPGSELNGVIPLGDGALLVGVHNPATSGETNGWMIAVDAAAKVRWEQRLGRGTYHYLWDAALDRRGHLLAVGARKAGTYQGWSIDVDKDGKLAGEQTDAARTWDTLLGIAVAGDEELYVTGKSSAHQDGDGVAVLTRRRSIAAETWRQQVLEGVVMVGAPIVHRRSVEFLVVTARGNNGSLHLVRASRDSGGAPVIHAIGSETFPLDWLTMPGWIVSTTDADTTVAQVRRAADGGVEWRAIRIARPPVR